MVQWLNSPNCRKHNGWTVPLPTVCQALETRNTAHVLGRTSEPITHPMGREFRADNTLPGTNIRADSIPPGTKFRVDNTPAGTNFMAEFSPQIGPGRLREDISRRYFSYQTRRSALAPSRWLSRQLSALKNSSGGRACDYSCAFSCVLCRITYTSGRKGEDSLRHHSSLRPCLVLDHHGPILDHVFSCTAQKHMPLSWYPLSPLLLRWRYSPFPLYCWGGVVPPFPSVVKEALFFRGGRIIARSLRAHLSGAFWANNNTSTLCSERVTL